MSAQLAPAAEAQPKHDVTPAADMQPAVDAQHPWLGLASFTEETRGYFHGREEEVAELGRRVQRKPLTILFGQSGLGKTSILRAGIVPRLRPEGYCPVYVRIDYSPDTPLPSEQIKQAIFRATESTGQWTKPGVAVEGETLWEFLHHRDDILRDASGKTVIPLLIFDQFEEIFTLAQADDAGRQRAAHFIDDLADLVENRLPKALEAKLENDESITERFDFSRADYRILIALREDYLAHLESVKGVMPSITQNRMRLARMNGQQALAAVMKPGGKLVSQEVAESIVRFIAGGAELRNAEVEPSLLSLICRELNNARIAQGRSEISADLLAGTHDTILAEFYERALADQPAAVRKVIEDQLLTESGFRESLAEERVIKAFAAAGAAPNALATLVNRRLLRIEERLDVRRVELTHDVLCGVVKASRELRLEREALEEAERKLATQRAREEATRKALVRARQIAAGCAVLALVAVAASVFGFIGMHRAQETRQMAETARGESERLIVYLLDDFYRELEPVGRLDIVAELARRAVDYYQGLPRELRTKETDRNRSLALVRYGAALRTQGKLTEAGPVLDDAIQTLDTLQKDGDTSEVTAIGLSLGLAAKSRVIDSSGRSVDTMPPSGRAVEVIKPVAEAPGSSVAARRTYGLALTQLGFFQMRQNRDDLATPNLQRALAMFRSIDDLQLKDLDAAANFSITSSWLSESLTIQGRNDEAKAVGAEGISVASKVLDQNPTHMLALRGRALLASNLARLEGTAFRPAEALAMEDDSARDWIMLLRVDPSNMIAWNNLGATRFGGHLSLLAQGRVRAAMAKLEEVRVAEPMTAKSGLVAGMYSFNRTLMGNLAAELGDIQRANAYNADAERYFKLSLESVPAGTFDYAYWSAFLEVWKAEAALSLGDFARTRSLADSARIQVEKLKPEAEFSRQQQAELLRRLSFALGTAAEWTNDFAGAEKQFRATVDYRKRTPVRNQFEQREAAVEVALHAATLARLGRLSEARQTIEPVVEQYRGYAARNKDNQTVKSEMAGVLYAAALANPEQGKTLLDEARGLFNSLPPELREMRSVAHLGNRIAEAKGQ